jgi:predicted RNA methylase
MDNTQRKGLRRNTIDKYYTKGSVVELCLNFVRNHLQIDKSDLIIEPSAGNGAFIPGIKKLSEHCVFYDLEPEQGEIIKQDYLLVDSNAFKTSEARAIHVIGNPPFGRQSSMAIRFIKKSCEFCNTIAFILPKSFKKDSLKKTFPLCFHLVFEMDLPDKSFLVNGEEYSVDSVFQIWEKKSVDRVVVDKAQPIGFVFVDKNAAPDISVRRVGVYAGKIDTHSSEKSVQSHYFIKFTNNRLVSENMEKLKSIEFAHNNTVGPRSISKQELIAEFNRSL